MDIIEELRTAVGKDPTNQDLIHQLHTALRQDPAKDLYPDAWKDFRTLTRVADNWRIYCGEREKEETYITLNTRELATIVEDYEHIYKTIRDLWGHREDNLEGVNRTYRWPAGGPIEDSKLVIEVSAEKAMMDDQNFDLTAKIKDVSEGGNMLDLSEDEMKALAFYFKRDTQVRK
jgi:hypothetical protein